MPQQQAPTPAPLPPVDLGPTNDKIDNLRQSVEALIVELREDRADPAPMPMPRPEPVPTPAPPPEPIPDEEARKAAADALAAATEAKAVAAKNGEVLTSLTTEQGKLRESLSTTLSTWEKWQQRKQNWQDAYREETGQDPSYLQTVIGAGKEAAADRGVFGMGFSVGKILAGALGASAPIAVGIGVLGWFIGRKIKGKVEAGEPLLIQRLLDKTTIDDRIREWLHPRAAAPAPPTAPGTPIV